MSNVKCCNCGRSGHYWRDCREMWWSEEKAIGKGRLNSAESSNWEEGRLGGTSQSYREQDEEHADVLWMIGGFEINSTEGCWSKSPRRGREAKKQRVRRWQRPREETVSVKTREEGARARGRVRGEIDQLKDDEKKGKQPGIGTPEPVERKERCKVRVSTTDMRNLRTGTRTTDGHASAGGRC